ncbi:hypothetical protein HPB47_021779, partial [Ixodes persulcatus]
MAARLTNEDNCNGASYMVPVHSEPVVRLLQPMIDREEDQYDHIDLARGKTLLEVGVGPIAWYSFMSSNRFNDIVLSDLVEDNRKELEKWLNKSEDAIDWTDRAEQVAALEGYSDVKKGASDIMERTRSSIRKVVPCNVLEPGVLPEEHRETFDVVLSCNCLESATADHESFRSVVNNVGSLVKPGGLFLLGGLGGLESYFMGSANFIMANVTED